VADHADKLLTTPELARALSLSTKSIQRYLRDGKIKPAYTTPGGHHRWDLADVTRQLRELRPRDD
jgi:DNA-binding transcriptional MerR regulator